MVVACFVSPSSKLGGRKYPYTVYCRRSSDSRRKGVEGALSTVPVLIGIHLRSGVWVGMWRQSLDEVQAGGGFVETVVEDVCFEFGAAAGLVDAGVVVALGLGDALGGCRSCQGYILCSSANRSISPLILCASSGTVKK